MDQTAELKPFSSPSSVAVLAAQQHGALTRASVRLAGKRAAFAAAVLALLLSQPARLLSGLVPNKINLVVERLPELPTVLKDFTFVAVTTMCVLFIASFLFDLVKNYNVLKLGSAAPPEASKLSTVSKHRLGVITQSPSTPKNTDALKRVRSPAGVSVDHLASPILASSGGGSVLGSPRTPRAFDGGAGASPGAVATPVASPAGLAHRGMMHSSPAMSGPGAIIGTSSPLLVGGPSPRRGASPAGTPRGSGTPRGTGTPRGSGTGGGFASPGSSVLGGASSPKSSLWHHMPIPPDDFAVFDERSLQRFVAERDASQQRLFGPSSVADRLKISQIVPHEYRTALPARDSASSSTKSSDDDKSGFLNMQLSEALLCKLGIDSYMDAWTERCRVWLSTHVLNDLVTSMNRVDQTMKASNLPNLMTHVPVQAYIQSQQQTLQQLALQNPPLLTQIHKRQMLERFFVFDGNYRWNSGGKFKGKEWHPDLPTDAQIVMHLFCTFLDFILPADALVPKGKHFTARYFQLQLDSSEPPKHDVVIAQTNIHPPHFKIISMDERWEIFQGRNNLFHAIILFLYFIKTRRHGFVGPMHIDSIGLDLEYIISTN
ncbi:hypothetical protein CAOG_01539 [Capsaspora owczarzaki ATCC 30864]|uniref:Transmembrane protein 209 n=1 Tax=Capsaspora owczarzaki (strain ATCC 30864) TaxID=595528 RepID=A0A0D2U4W9_CAPO3|nr:hypothetical protein CAOG_01539 [Capsaspora owczarzaki ATCC 30864]KJE90196.1 hypothetical protein CAOG_001539 [Capsaspora owczarzaki ATCC 30864]|eukprot:XP_004364407.2 hypothetical protein CAOG_01539 [Capsaspora owczarzaki ATCC 30864]